jgi:hypothetical protein
VPGEANQSIDVGDDITGNPAPGTTYPVATELIGGRRYQAMKVTLGGDGAAEKFLEESDLQQASEALTIDALGSRDASNITGAHQLLLTPAGNYRFLRITNSTKADVVISLDAGTTDHFNIPGGTMSSIDLGALGGYADITTYTAIHVKYDSATTSKGKVTATVIR